MKLKLVSLFVASAVAAVVAASCGTGQQPSARCAVGHGDFAVALTPIDASQPTCADHAPYQFIAAGKYGGKADDSDLPDVGLKPAEIWQYDFDYANLDMTAVGTLTSRTPNDDGFCTATGFAAIEGTEFRYEFGDVEFYVSPRAPGTQLRGTVTITTLADSCAATYNFTGLYPTVDCTDDATVCPTADTEGAADPYHMQVNPDFVSACSAQAINSIYGPWNACVVESVPALKGDLQ